MSYYAKIIFGKDQVNKFYKNEPFTDCERIINLKDYTFETKAERIAFYKGIGEAMGRLEFIVIGEFEDNISTEKVDESKFDYWTFIEKYYPNYSTCDQILLSDILARKLEGEEIDIKDEEMIKEWNIKEELLKLDQSIMQIAMENYFEMKYFQPSLY